MARYAVVIPAYNEADYLPATLSALRKAMAAAAHSGRVVLVDNHSTDDTAKVARENGADRVNGIALEGRSDAVSAILVDLSQRRTREESGEFARLIVREGEGQMAFQPQPRRSAAFAVLKSPDVPSVLFEAGYITNPQEAHRLASAEGQARFADVVDKAIRIFFARQAGV